MLVVDASVLVVALAEVLGATLLTGDRRLAHASGPTCTIELLATDSR